MKNNELELIKNICQAESKLESLLLFFYNKETLKDWNIILSGDDYPTKMMPLFQTQMITHDCFLYNLFSGSSIFVLNKNMVESMMNTGSGDFSLDYSLSFDTQITSYLKRCVFNHSNQVPDSFFHVIDYIVNNNLNFDSLEYLYENMTLAFSRDSNILDTLVAYDILREIDVEAYHKERKIKSHLSQKQLYEMANADLDEFQFSMTNESCLFIYRPYQLCYIILLKMVLIQFHHPKKSKSKKLQMLLDFMQQDIGKICMRELIIANAYFEPGSHLKFFKKIQKNSPNNLHNLKNMAWDLFHLHQMERNGCLIPDNDIVFLPLFLTYDQGIKEIMELCSLLALAYNPNNGLALPIYEKLSVIEEFLQDEALSPYFSSEAFKKRTIVKNLHPIMNVLEEKMKSFET